MQAIIQAINEGKTALGIELGSTRIKAVLIDETFSLIASGSHEWENKLEDGVWTYSTEAVWSGLQDSFRKLADDVQTRYGVSLTKPGVIGISGMMHGYLPFDRKDRLLAPFRTWRNTMTEKAAKALTNKFQFTIPHRWNIAHLYHAILNGETHVKDLSFFTTLAGYVHWKLTGQKVLGIDDASGMFPIDSNTKNYDEKMLKQFNELLKPYGFQWKIEDLLPQVLCAGEKAGVLSEEGAKLLDPLGRLQAGIPLCPPEGDAGTGMVATNTIAERTGNISAGTSIFMMIVLERALSKLYPEIDMVCTPAGKPVAMVHCNNCTTDLDAWVKLFGEFVSLIGVQQIDKTTLYEKLYSIALDGEKDCGGLLSYNYYAGEPITGLEQGRPLFVRKSDSNFNLANFMRTLIFSAMGTLKIGVDILTEKENVRLDNLLGHGGLFKSKTVGQQLMAGALNTPVTLMESAGEGGAWGIALLAAYMLYAKENEQPLLSLEQFLEDRVFAGLSSSTIEPDAEDVKGFKKFMENYSRGLSIEHAAVRNF